MHILYLHQHFALPCGSTGTRSYEFAKRWVKSGHKVTVITGHYDIGGLQKPKSFIETRQIDDIDVLIVGTTYSHKQCFLRRTGSFLSFVLLSIIAALRLKNVDIIYATSTPLTIGIPAMVIKAIKRRSFVFEVRDQWPEIPIELGVIKNPVLKKILLWLEKRIYQSSAAIVALSPPMADGIRKIIGDIKPVTVTSNCSDTDLFNPCLDGSEIRKELGWDNKFVLLHFGAMGKANGLGFLITVAEKLRQNRDIHFVLIGNGKKKEKLQKDILVRALNNIEIIDSKPKKKLPFYVAACDVSTVIFANYPILEHNSANKFFDSLAAGKPVLLNYSGWQRQVLEDHNAGLGCTLCDIEEFVSNIKKLFSDSQLRKEMSQNARKLAEKEFSRDMLARNVLDVLENLSE